MKYYELMMRFFLQAKILYAKSQLMLTVKYLAGSNDRKIQSSEVNFINHNSYQKCVVQFFLCKELDGLNYFIVYLRYTFMRLSDGSFKKREI